MGDKASAPTPHVAKFKWMLVEVRKCIEDLNNSFWRVVRCKKEEHEDIKPKNEGGGDDDVAQKSPEWREREQV